MAIKNILKFSGVQKHGYHLVDRSPWPIVMSIAVMSTLLSAVFYMHKQHNSLLLFIFALIITILIATLWWRDVIREATFEGHHTEVVQKGLRLGMLLFILSEVMFFLGFFWAFFHSSLIPVVEIGAIWPPVGIEPFNPWQVPLLNTLILLLSGATITWVHHAIITGKRVESLIGFDATIALAIAFTALQGFEYVQSSFNISDGIYGSTFFMATGFHGFHVIIGTIFIIVCAIRTFHYQLTEEHHFGFEAAAWYWHFVDVVWLFLFVSIYWWGSI
jgi:cytochrome c oxidase subunit 3